LLNSCDYRINSDYTRSLWELNAPPGAEKDCLEDKDGEEAQFLSVRRKGNRTCLAAGGYPPCAAIALERTNVTVKASRNLVFNILFPQI